MINTAFADALHRTGFEHRTLFMPDGSVIYRLRDGSGSVRLSQAKLEAIGSEYAREIAALRKRSRRLNLALFPAIFVFATTLGQFLPFAGLLILLGLFGGPLAIYLWHSRKAEIAAAAAESRLASYPRTAAVEFPVGRPPRALQIAVMVLVGPYLIVATIGHIGGPETFRNTPWTGAHIGWRELVAFGLLGLLWWWPTVAHKLFRR